MLVLTRRSKDKILFPQLGIAIHFIRVQSGQVKVGVDAPREIKILREEVDPGNGSSYQAIERQLAPLSKELRHQIRNELHEVTLGLHLYRELERNGLSEEADNVFNDLKNALKSLDAFEALNPPAMTVKPTSNTVLVVDDVQNEREMLAGILRMRKLDVVTLADGEEVISYFEHNPAPGFLLIDMKMPCRDGAETVSYLRKNGRLDSTCVFAVSGMSPGAYGISVGDGGVDRWFPKPLNPTTLLDAMAIAN